jgi:hypothetical protein
MPNPWLLLGLALAWAASVAGAFTFGRDVEQGAQALAERTAAAAVEAANVATGEALAKIEVQRVEITQPVIHEVRTRTVYAECRHTADGLRGVNAALTGRAVAAGASQLPAASAPGR